MSNALYMPLQLRCAPPLAMHVGALTETQVLSSPDCANPDTLAANLKALGMASKAEFAKAYDPSLSVDDPLICLALAIAGGAVLGGMDVGGAMKKARIEAETTLAHDWPTVKRGNKLAISPKTLRIVLFAGGAMAVALVFGYVVFPP